MQLVLDSTLASPIALAVVCSLLSRAGAKAATLQPGVQVAVRPGSMSVLPAVQSVLQPAVQEPLRSLKRRQPCTQMIFGRFDVRAWGVFRILLSLGL